MTPEQRKTLVDWAILALIAAIVLTLSLALMGCGVVGDIAPDDTLPPIELEL